MNSATASLGKIKSKSFKSTKSAKKAVSVWTQKLSEATIIKITAAILVLALIGVGSWRIANFYHGRIFPNVKVAGVKIGGKTSAQAKIAVQSFIDQANSEGVKMTYQDQKINPHLDELGLAFSADQVTNDAYNFGRSGNWKIRLKDNFNMATGRAKVTMTPQIDQGKFDAELGKIVQVVEVPAQNAGIVITNGNISVTPSAVGRGVDKIKLQNDLKNMINQNKLDTQITLITSVLQPAVKEPGTAQAQGQAARFMQSAPIQLTYQDKTFTANKADVGNWISFSASGDKLVADVDPQKVGGYVASIAKKVEVKKVDRVVMADTGQVLEEGQDGIGMDANGLVKNLRNRVLSASSGPAIAIATYGVPKGEKVKYPHAQPCRYDTRYVDVNLSEQTLYAFEGCNLVNQFLISSGLTGPTPTGEFHVYSKSRVTRMTGPGYDLPGVEWVSWFTGDYSIHGTYWHHNFGHPMSHGCVNASNGDAEWLYGWDDVGTPVYIHY